MELLVEQFETLSGVVLQPANAPIADAEFFALCAKYPDCRVETTAEGDILIMPPAHPRTGQRNAAINHQLFAWSEVDGRGEAFDSSAGFFLANGARRSPDSAWISRERLKSVTDDAAMWYVTPDFIIELKSASDRVETVRAKMREWTSNSVALAWLIIPGTRSVEIYRASGPTEVLANPAEVHGECPVEGFVLRLTRIWQGIQA